MTTYGQQRLIDLMNRLIQLTEDAKIHWSETDNEAAYQFATRTSSVVVGKRDDNTRPAPLFIEIYGQSGTVVDSLESNEEVIEDSWGNLVEPSWNGPLSRLYHMARRSALNIDAVLDALLAELPKDDPPPGFSDEPPF